MKASDLKDLLGEPLLPRKHRIGLAVLLLLAISLKVFDLLYPPDEGTKFITASPVQEPTQIIFQSVSVLETMSSEPLSPPQASLPVAPDAVSDSKKVIVKTGDNLSLIFNRVGLSAADVQELINNAENESVLNHLYPGYELTLFFDTSGRLTIVNVMESDLLTHHYEKEQAGGYSYSLIERVPEIRQTLREATITDSLFLSAQQNGIPAGITMETAGIFGGVIDFILDVREGDSFKVLYEEKFLDGKFVDNGKVLAAQFTNQGTVHTALRYTNAVAQSNFYNPQGESMRKAFLLNPVDFTRISSGFNPVRKHPILNTIRAHKGTDYAAPRGTPVVATADGRISFAGRNGSFGNLVVIKHDDRFETKYAHLNGYARGVLSGARIRQGQVIGYVGSTGSATGPHLHYEFLMDGVHRNSRTIHQSLPKADSIPEEELPLFRQQTTDLLATIDSGRTTQQIAFVGPLLPQE